MHPVVAEMIATDHTRRMHEYALAHRAERAVAVRRRPRGRVRRRAAVLLVRLAGRMDPVVARPAHRHSVAS